MLFSRFAARPFHHRTVPVLAGLLGIVERVVWAATRDTPHATGEAEFVAVALAEGRGFADAFMPGQGPTAHLTPLSPLIGSIPYRLLGVQSFAAEAVLLGWSLLLTFGCYLLFAGIARRLGASPAAIVGGFVALALLPIYTTSEAFDFRVWEGGIALLLAGATLRVVLMLDRGEAVRRPNATLGMLAALTFFVNPPLGLAMLLAIAILWVRRRRAVAILRVGLFAALALAATVGPWTVRNCRMMQQCIGLRDNLGLELAVGNDPAMAGSADPRTTFNAHLDAIHPHDRPGPYAAMRAAGGEAAYARMQGRIALRWIGADRARTARLWATHAREMLFTRTWMFMTAHGRWLPPFRSTVVTLIALLALLRIALAVRRRDGRFLYPALLIAVPVGCYLPFQPVVRYSWVLYPLLTYLAADMLVRLGGALAMVRPSRTERGRNGV
jgi:hypothetical protein